MDTGANTKMKVEIWSDIMCPFCYIGKRNYESAISQFEGRDDIEVEWKSFQLDPTIQQKPGEQKNVYTYLAERKGMPYEKSVKMHEGVVETARKAGLDYHFEKAIVANSFNAHRVIQMAKTKGLGDAAEERFFHAYFTEGKNYGDPATLLELGLEIGLTKEDVQEALTNDIYAGKVRDDIEEGDRLGIRGVPFFVFNRQYAVSGAQPPAVFLQTLEKSVSEWEKEVSDF